MNLAYLSNEELLAGVHTLANQGRALLARLLAYLAEVEERRLDLQSACSSLFDFCVRRLGMSEDEAYRRVAAARLVRRFPVALGMIERGAIHLTGLLMLREHLNAESGEDLLRASAGKSKSELQHLLAERFPRPDVPSRLLALNPALAPPPDGMGKEGTGSQSTAVRDHSRIEPLAPARYRVEFTASASLREKLRHAVDLMRHANPSGDLSVLVERALDLLLAKLEQRRLAKLTRAPRPGRSGTRRGYVPLAVRREVFARDGERCTFLDEAGRRCESRAWLELDHRIPRADGGPDDASNLTVRCRAHNRLSAERQFGREHMDRCAGKRRIVERTVDEHEDPGSEAAAREASLTESYRRREERETRRELPTGGAVQTSAGAESFANRAAPDPPARGTAGSPDGVGPGGSARSSAGGVGAGGVGAKRQGWPEGPVPRDDATVPGRGLPAPARSSPGGATGQCGSHEIVFRALCLMGFTAHETRHALRIVDPQRTASPRDSIESLLRRALAVLA
jgi:hypothetical protein